MVGPRFDNSFIIRTIRDFFIVLVLVMTVELGVRFAAVLHDYYVNEEARTKEVAERLSDNIKSIMINQGGPVAARTVYPILKKNQKEIGYDIAIVPSEKTIESISKEFGYIPRGLPPDWQKGEHHEASVELRAEPFCQSCHSSVEVGGSLGYVTARSYLSSQIDHWFEEVRLTGLFGMGNVILHTILLFILLRIRMEPLLSFRSLVSRLSKAGADISHRANINSNDEFGELANDMNLFLDRLSLITQDVDEVLAQVNSLNHKLQDVRKNLEDQLGQVNRTLDATTRAAVSGNQTLLGEKLASLNGNIAKLPHFIGEMSVLEEKMQNLSGEGQKLVERLLPDDQKKTDHGKADQTKR